MTEPNDFYDAVRRETHRIEEDCKVSSKAHFNAAASWKRTHYWIGIPATILAAVASGSAFSDHGTVAAIIGIVVTTLTALVTFLDPTGRKNAHKGAGNQYLALRNMTRLFRELEVEGEDPKTLRKRISELSSQRNGLNESSPSIPDAAFKKAKEGIESGEADYEVDQASR